MAQQTPNLGFSIPDEGSDDDLWGGMLNGNWSGLDMILQSMIDQITALTDQVEKNKVPVGGLYFSTTDTDPAATLGYGSWSAYAAGRAIVGVGTGDGVTWTAGQIRGNASRTLTEAQMPAHTHSVDPPNVNGTTGGGGAHTHSVRGSGIMFTNHNSGAAAIGFTNNNSYFPSTPDTLPSVGDHTHSFSVNIPAFNSGSKGSNQAFDIIQPSVGVYIWRRTA